MKFSRKDYLNNICTHSEYYQQFVTSEYVVQIANYIGKELLLSVNSLNEIPLKVWDFAPSTIGVNQKMKLVGDYLTQSGKVCIAKQAAQIWLNFNKLD